MNIVIKTEPFIADSLQRSLRDLRISVTDRCNLRCTYCMPRAAFGKDFVFLPRAELLSFEEIERIYTCLFAVKGVDLRDPLRRRESDAMLSRLIMETWERRADRYSQLRHAATEQPGRKIEMSYIGG